MAGRRLVVLFDGTWNAPGDDGDIGAAGVTNVQKLRGALPERGADGVAQVVHYEKGVGTRWYNRLRGGAFGVGLSDILGRGYRFLVRHWEEGDQLFIVGFSRGAYTARSLVGMLRNVGLLAPAHVGRFREAEAIYRVRDEGPDSANAVTFRERYSREVRVQCLAVWDTVGALGVPLNSFDWFNRPFYEFHDTELSGIVHNAFQALAIDEHRRSYEATLWDPMSKPGQHIEQVWFAGAHCNVGGGYAAGDSRLEDLPLHWMADRLRQAGLAIDLARLPPEPDAVREPLIDSYGRFLNGRYSRVADRHHRALGRTVFGAEALHPSVVQRLQHDPHYRPGNPVGERLAGFVATTAGRLR